MKQASKKYIPSSCIIEIGATIDGKPYARPIIEKFSNNKQEMEQSIAIKFIESYNSKNDDRFNCIQMNPPDPDFFCKDGERAIALELIELVSRSVALRKLSVLYSEALQDKFNNPKIALNFASEKVIKIPKPNTKEGSSLLSDLSHLLLDEIARCESIPEKELPLMPLQSCMALNSDHIQEGYPGLHIYASTTGEVIGGVCFGLTEEDYTNVEKNIKNKFLKDYSMGSGAKRILLIHAFDSAHPDFDRLNNLCKKYHAHSKHPFDEVWYLFAFPNNQHMFELVFPRKDAGKSK